MLREEFETWYIDPIIKETLVNLNLYVNTLGYLERKSPCFVELPNGGTEENGQIIGLNTTAIIPKNNQQLNPTDLNDLKVKQAKKKEEKAQKQ